MVLAKVYHGSIIAGIKILEPKKRFTPGALGKDVPLAIYATDDPGYAAAHSFPWSSREGFDAYYKSDKLILKVPKLFQDRLEQEICIYTLPVKQFSLLKNVKPIGRNYWAHVPIKPISAKCFPAVSVALKYYGVKIKII